MTQWGMLLLCVYIALGASSRLKWRTAGRIAFGITVVVIGAAMVSYMRGTPTDKYYKAIDAPVYATGRATATPGQSVDSTEDTSGAQPATRANTVLPAVNPATSPGG